MLFLPFQNVCLYQCGICVEFEFEKRYQCERHMLEVHSGFGYKCDRCGRIYNRPENHQNKCPDSTLSIVNRRTQTYTENEAREYTLFRERLSILINRVPRVISSNPTARQERAKENRRRSHLKQTTQPAKKLKPLKETNRQPTTYVPITEPISPVPLSLQPPSVPTAVLTSPSAAPLKTPDLVPAVTLPAPASKSPAVTPPVPAIQSPTVLGSISSSASWSSAPSTKAKEKPEPALSVMVEAEELQSVVGNEVPDHKDDSYTVQPAAGPSYNPTPVTQIRLQGLALSQQQRLYLNVGGTKFETSGSTLQADPSSLLALMILPSSPLKPYSVDNIYTYFLDRDPKLFHYILTYLRNGAELPLRCLP